MNPTVLLEVTSDSSEEYDTRDKLEYYRTIPLSARLRHRLTPGAPNYGALTLPGRRVGDTGGHRGRERVESLGTELSVDEVYRESSVRRAPAGVPPGASHGAPEAAQDGDPESRHIECNGDHRGISMRGPRTRRPERLRRRLAGSALVAVLALSHVNCSDTERPAPFPVGGGTNPPGGGVVSTPDPNAGGAGAEPGVAGVAGTVFESGGAGFGGAFGGGFGGAFAGIGGGGPVAFGGTGLVGAGGDLLPGFGGNPFLGPNPFAGTGGASFP